MPRRVKRQWLFRLSALGLGLVVFWGIPELIVRWWNPPLQSFRTIIFGDLETSPKLFVKDPRLGWTLRPSTEVRFLGRLLEINRDGFRGVGIAPGRRVILCLGDSTTFGWGVNESESYAAQLQARLERDPRAQGRWQVINAGVPAYSSYQLLLEAQELVHRLRPEVVVVCTGNNEAWPVERSDRHVYTSRSPLGLALSRVLSQSRFLLWLAETIAPDRTKPYRAPPARLATPRVSLQEMQANLRAMARLASKYKATLIVVAPPVNLYHPPIERELLRVLDTVDHRELPEAPPSREAVAELARWREDYAEIDRLLTQKETERAIAEAQRLCGENRGDFRYLWLVGMALSAAGHHDEGRAAFEEAFEHHSFPDRCKLSYRRAIEAVARALSLPYVDANELFRERAKPGLPLGFYLDWCHPSAAGHALIAQALFDQIVASRLDTAKRLVPVGSQPASAKGRSMANAKSSSQHALRGGKDK